MVIALLLGSLPAHWRVEITELRNLGLGLRAGGFRLGVLPRFDLFWDQGFQKGEIRYVNVFEGFTATFTARNITHNV